MYVNIGKDKKDVFYRYKRELTRVSVERNKTIVLNLYKISQQLVGNFSDQSSAVFNAIVKTLRKKLSLNIKVEEKTNNVILHGKVDVAKIEEILETFIVRYILCPKCKLPEWNGNTCTACGHVSS
jgi:translation initiation factor 5